METYPPLTISSESRFRVPDDCVVIVPPDMRGEKFAADGSVAHYAAGEGIPFRAGDHLLRAMGEGVLRVVTPHRVTLNHHEDAVGPFVTVKGEPGDDWRRLIPEPMGAAAERLLQKYIRLVTRGYGESFLDDARRRYAAEDGLEFSDAEWARLRTLASLPAEVDDE